MVGRNTDLDAIDAVITPRERKNFARNLRKWRLARHMTQRELAGEITSPGQISKYETGKARIRFRHVLALSKRLDVRSAFLFEDEPHQSQS